MNVTLTNLLPLPTALSQPGKNGSGRRHLIGQYDIDSEALQWFNELLQRLNLRRAPLERDQVATAARELIDGSHPSSAPTCIHQRMRCGAAIDLMMTDRGWDTVPAAEPTATLVVDYLRGRQSLIPNALPVVGRLDDAIVVEAAMPTVADEVRNYLDFYRIRHVEAELRGKDAEHFSFNRNDWVEAAQAEAEWIAHCRRVDETSYLSGYATPRFRVS